MTSSAAWCDTCQTSRTGSFMCMHDHCPHGNQYKPTFVNPLMDTYSAPVCGTCGETVAQGYECQIFGCPEGCGPVLPPTPFEEGVSILDMIVYKRLGEIMEEAERVPPTVDGKPILMCDRCDKPGHADCIQYGCAFVEGGYHNPISRDRAIAIAEEEVARGNKSKEFADNKRAYDVRKLKSELVVRGLPDFIAQHGDNPRVVGWRSNMTGYVLACELMAEHAVDDSES